LSLRPTACFFGWWDTLDDSLADDLCGKVDAEVFVCNCKDLGRGLYDLHNIALVCEILAVPPAFSALVLPNVALLALEPQVFEGSLAKLLVELEQGEVGVYARVVVAAESDFGIEPRCQGVNTNGVVGLGSIGVAAQVGADGETVGLVEISGMPFSGAVTTDSEEANQGDHQGGRQNPHAVEHGRLHSSYAL